MSLFRTAVETAVSETHKLLHTGGVPTSLTLVLTVVTVSLAFADRSARTSYSCLPPLSPSLMSCMVSVDFKHHVSFSLAPSLKSRIVSVDIKHHPPPLQLCVKVEVAVLSSPSLISLMVSVDVKHHERRSSNFHTLRTVYFDFVRN